MTLLANAPAVLVRVQAHRGSVPRESDAWMAVFDQSCLGTVGGGQLEWQAMAQARVLLGDPSSAPVLMRYPLGPSMGQCCGGEVHLRYERVSAVDVPALRQQFDAVRARWPWLVLFGGGHVGAALVRLLASLPVQVQWIDSREGIFPLQLPDNVVSDLSEPVQLAVPSMPARALVLIMSFSHAQDLDVVAACLSRQRQNADLSWIGLIGSQSKWATFRNRLAQRGFTEAEMTRVQCPIGLHGIRGKQPEVIAVSVAAQVLQVLASGGKSADPLEMES
ncbi:MAG: xanthine dehydrogenase accessory protein XdhC [Rhodoferax sp.]|nr:xanthine dehydrogenase accessory protein XdhC [Rhodoferax sp.]